ncbi:MAG: ImmA/IrrE family metallo-endopeptidase, partial [Chloroflexi bacterium]|nr:ImmA/IrrE family metallo-endopeptidase [Chloroflexota bacterium]
MDLEKIALSLGITLIPYPLPSSICGFAYLGKSKFIIYNSNHPLTRQRFTIAHEIYHIEKHLMRERMIKKHRKVLEEEANRGAAKILLPYSDLLAHIKEAHWRYDLTSLAKKAIVSPITLVKRLDETKLLKVSLYKISLKGSSPCISKLYGDSVPLPNPALLREG